MALNKEIQAAGGQATPQQLTKMRELSAQLEADPAINEARDRHNDEARKGPISIMPVEPPMGPMTGDYMKIGQEFGGKAPFSQEEFSKVAATPQGKQTIGEYIQLNQEFGGKAPFSLGELYQVSTTPEGKQTIGNYLNLAREFGNVPFSLSQFNQLATTPQGKQQIQQQVEKLAWDREISKGVQPPSFVEPRPPPRPQPPRPQPPPPPPPPRPQPPRPQPPPPPPRPQPPRPQPQVLPRRG